MVFGANGVISMLLAAMVHAGVIISQHHQISPTAHLVKLELDAAVSGYVREGQLVERRQQQLHEREEGLQGGDVVVA